MSEPEFIFQCGDPMSADERRAWIERTVASANREGSVFGRVTIHPEIPDLILFEGWKTRPDDQGEPRFQLACIPQESADG